MAFPTLDLEGVGLWMAVRHIVQMHRSLSPKVKPTREATKTPVSHCRPFRWELLLCAQFFGGLKILETCPVSVVGSWEV